MIRRLKKDVLTQLPPKRRQKIAFDVSQESKHMKELESLKIDFKKCSAILKGEANEDQSIQSPLMEMKRLSILLYHYTGLVKIVPIQEYISNLIESMDGKVIVFFRHRLVMKGIIQKLVSKKVKYICIAGDVPSGMRGDLVNQFQCDCEVRVAVLSIEAASFGLTLTAAHHVVFAELHFTPGMIIQAEDRAHRIGQTLPVNVHYLIARGTLDETLWAMIRRKVYVTSSALDGECKEFQTEDGTQEESQRLSACAAWVQDQEEDDENDLEEFVMEQLSSKTANTSNNQRDLRSFFSPAVSTSKDCSLMKKDEGNFKVNNMKGEPVTVLDSDDEDFFNCGYLQDFACIKEGNHDKDTAQDAENVPSEDLQTGGNLHAQNNSASHLESPCNKDPCPLKPKMLKFKKEKDDELHLSGSKSSATPNRGETSLRTCLDFVSNDPDTDSQTMQSYLENPCEHVDVKSCEEEGVCGAAVRSEGNRSFFVSLKDADAECVLVVCKKGTVLPKQEKVNQDSSNNKQVDEVASSESYRTKEIENESSNHDSELEGSCAKEARCDQVDAGINCLDALDSNHIDCEVSGSDQNDSSCRERMISSMEAIHVEHLPSCGLRNSTCGSYVDGIGSLCSRQDQCELDFADKNELNKDPSQREEGERSVDVLESFCKCSSSDRINSCCSNGPAKLQEESSRDSSDEFEHSNTRKGPPPRPSVPKKGRRHKANRKPKITCRKQKANREINSKTVTPLGWSCVACTFINNGQLVECSICLTPRITTSECQSKEADTYVVSNQGFGNVNNNSSCSPVAGLVDTSCRRNTETTTAGFENNLVDGDSLTDTAIKNTGNSSTMSHPAVQCRGLEGLNSNVNNGYLALGCNQSVSFSSPTAMAEKEPREREILPRSDSSSLQEQAEMGDSNDSHLRDLPPWSCSACTFLNQWQMIECSVCLTPRRRSQRHSASQWSTFAMDRRRKENHNKKTSEQENSRGSGYGFSKDIPIDCKLRETEIVPITACGIDLTMKTDDTHGRMVGVEKGLTSESGDRFNGETLNSVCRVPNNNPCFQSCSDFTVLEDSSHSSDGSASLRSHSRKKFKLDDCHINDASENSCGIADFSDDSDQLVISCRITSEASSPKNANLGNLETSSLGDGLQSELSSPGQISSLDNLENETLEDLEAAANEMFSASDWEEDDFLCESGVCSGQSSLLSSNETVSPGNQGLGTPSTSGFRKCSDLFSLTDLQNKLQASPYPDKIESLNNRNRLVDAKQTLPSDVVCTDTNQESTTCHLFPEVEEDQDSEPEQPPEPIKLKFCLSFYTDRVYLYDEDSTPLNVNFSMSDVKNRNLEDLPAILHNEHNLKQAKRFLQLWDRMGEGKRRVLRNSALVIDDPLLGYENARQGKTRETSYIRHPSEDQRIQKVKDTAEQVGGKVCIVTKPKAAGWKSKGEGGTGNKSSKGKNHPSLSPSHSTLSTNSIPESTSTTCHQAFNADGTPLCLFCSTPVYFGDRVSCSAWDQRFCSFDCKKEYQVRNSGATVRRNLFELEKGICQVCSLNAHEMYSAVKTLPVKERPSFLAGTVYASLPRQTLKRMVMDPKEGMFWEADHIRAVAEGGGQCGLDNYRTLCIPCHRKATFHLNRRLRRHKVMQEAAGSLNISTFFQPVS